MIQTRYGCCRCIFGREHSGVMHRKSENVLTDARRIAAVEQRHEGRLSYINLVVDVTLSAMTYLTQTKSMTALTKKVFNFFSLSHRKNRRNRSGFNLIFGTKISAAVLTDNGCRFQTFFSTNRTTAHWARLLNVCCFHSTPRSSSPVS
jgi:hypothetical protein